ncbi:aspartate/glutamate racemase family protein [Bradyrhizobium diazoefficiens]|nr:aspartate/glutamate racemase family protein [Bradyrhizobium diazoefficiens]MBR0775984.1 aspartate/glutamate racemase family protein [Bradyrhizobium diazoefficiens]
MHVGLIGGIGPAATDFYYRRLIAAFASRKTPLELTIAHADTPTLLKNLASNDKAGQAAIFARLTERLAVAGANCVAITSIAGHFCMDAFKAVSPLRAVDMIVEVNQAIAERGLNRVGILGTQTVMETRFYGGVTSAEIIAPGGQELLDVHQAYVTMAASGVITEAQRSVFDAASHRLLKKGAQAILLGGTDLVLVYDERTSSFPLIDCASIHADAIARLAIG